MKRYSVFAIAREALRYHQGWEKAWASPAPSIQRRAPAQARDVASAAAKTTAERGSKRIMTLICRKGLGVG